MDGLTKEQEQKLWEYFGFRRERIGNYKQEDLLVYPDGYSERVFISDWPELTLDKLFKWAVPKLARWEMGSNPDDSTWARVALKGNAFPDEVTNADPAQALAQAILKAIEGEK